MDLNLYSQATQIAGMEPIMIYFANRLNGERMKSTASTLEELKEKLYEEIAADFPFVERSRIRLTYVS